MRRNARYLACALLCLGLLPAPQAARGGPATLEDLFGPTGNRFAGSIGFQVREANTQREAVSGYGLGVDDVVVEWREFTLEEDATECAGGNCAVINLATNNLFERSGLVAITVVDASPSGNDCDLDGVVDTPRDRDCDNNLIPDVIVVVDSFPGSDSEPVILNAVAGSETSFKGSLPISAILDVPGTLFVAIQGNINPRVRATYLDLDDGTGIPCRNSVDPASWGRVQAFSTVFLTPAALTVTRYVVEDNGDHDGWADTGETIRLRVEVSNKAGADVTGLRLWLRSDDPAIACITLPSIAFGDLPAGATRFGDESFEFIVDSAVERATPFDDLTATLEFSLAANEFDAAEIPQRVTLDLDLDAVGGAGPTTFFEGFEDGFGAFTTMHLDESLNPPDSDLGNRAAGVLNADGWRCQYSDPGWEWAAPYGSSQGLQCFPNPNGAADVFYFDVGTDRAFSGAQSLTFNVYLDAARGFTTPTAQVEAVRTVDPINLRADGVCAPSRDTVCLTDADCAGGEACEAALPLLSFKHQVSQLDHRSVGAQRGRGADRAVVAVQLADNVGNPAGDWVKVYPFVNAYDTQANSNFFNCSFDPADDGNTEGDFFDPSDPRRSQGPSSTCAPEFSFVHQGDTDGVFDPIGVGDAADGPGLAGAVGRGTWVEPVFDLLRYRGRRIRLRLLETGLKLGSTASWEQAFSFNPDPGDDGWFVDDVQVTDALTTPAAVLADAKDNSALPTCDARQCGEAGGVRIVAQLDPPGGSLAPGQVLEIDVSRTAVDVCKSGLLQYRFWLEIDGDPAYRPNVDVLLRDWTDNPRFRDTPRGTTAYGVAARCATDPTCATTQVVTGTVGCPASGDLTGGSPDNAFLHRAARSRRTVTLDAVPVGGDKEVRLAWSTLATVDVIRGDLSALRSSGGFGAGEVCVADDLNDATRLVDAAPTATPGAGLFWILRSAEACNVPRAGGSYGGVGEAGDRDAGLTGGSACLD